MEYKTRSRYVRMEVWMQVKDAAMLRQQIRTAGHTNRSLARAVGCNHSFINRLVSGDARSCSSELAADIAEALRVHVDLIFSTNVSTLNGQSVRSGRSRRTAA